MNPFARLEYSIMCCIFSRLHIGDLAAIWACDEDMALDVREFVANRVAFFLGKFQLDFTQTLSLLDRANAVISGSFAQRMLFPGDALMTYSPGDIDFYIPATSRSIFLRFFAMYTPYVVVSSRNTRYYSDAISEVLLLVSGKSYINIIVSSNDNAIFPIFYFHSTCVMNFLSSAGIFCAYPELTFNLRNLPNSLHTQTANHARRFQACMKKYWARGFSTAKEVSKWKEFAHHTCYQNFNCPMTIRSTLDAGCFFLPVFDDAETAYSGRSGWGAYGQGGITWRLGGLPCNGNGKKVLGYVGLDE
ncbi:hypothetical protein CPC08DRAFT_648284 [Agrocybe pediades]|nr:hypothetical protein CPC08DRAFT_648284 [Agrocybe pediades]